MAVKVGINGFGRIGRNFMRSALGNSEIDIVSINDLTDAATLAHLLKYDSNYGVLDADISSGDGTLTVNGKTMKVHAEKNPADLPWGDEGVDIVIESTGLFREREKAALHLEGGAKKVIISAPGKGQDIMIVMGVNQDKYDAANHHIISNASCTTNCLAPLAKVILDNFGIETGLMCTIHSYTNGQKILDMQYKDLRRARAAALSIIPTTTGAANAVGEVIPEVKGRLTGYAMRVPTPTVSVVDLAVVTGKKVTVDEMNAAVKAASEGAMKGILRYEEAPLVSMDFKGSKFSSIFDPALTQMLGDNHIKVVSWYDNEMGYSTRLGDLAVYVGKSL